MRSVLLIQRTPVRPRSLAHTNADAGWRALGRDLARGGGGAKTAVLEGGLDGVE